MPSWASSSPGLASPSWRALCSAGEAHAVESALPVSPVLFFLPRVSPVEGTQFPRSVVLRSRPVRGFGVRFQAGFHLNKRPATVSPIRFPSYRLEKQPKEQTPVLRLFSAGGDLAGTQGWPGPRGALLWPEALLGAAGLQGHQLLGVLSGPGLSLRSAGSGRAPSGTARPWGGSGGAPLSAFSEGVHRPFGETGLHTEGSVSALPKNEPQV